MQYKLKSLFVVLLLCSVSAFADDDAKRQPRCELSRISNIANNPALMRLEFSEDVKGFSLSDISVVGGAAKDLASEEPDKNASSVFRFKVDVGDRAAKKEATFAVKIPAGVVMGINSGKKNIQCSRSVNVKKQTKPTPAPRNDGGEDDNKPEPTPQATATFTPTTVPSTPAPTEVPIVPTSTATPTSTFTRAPTMVPTLAPTLPPTIAPTIAPTLSVPSGDSPELNDACSSDVTARSSMLPVFPGAEGFGTFTVAGSGRNSFRPCTRVYKVSNLRDSGPGSLRECLEGKGPRVCVFEVSGLIWATHEMRVTSPFLTVAGQTAPSPGIVLRGSDLSIEASDVLIQHIRMRVGDDPRAGCCKSNSCSLVQAQFCTSDPGSRDGIKTLASKGGIKNIVLDHISVSWALDEGMSIVPDTGDVENISISNSLIGSGLDLSIHPEASNPKDPGHSKAFLINGNGSVSNFSFHKNLLAHNAERNIRASTPLRMEYVNNIVYDWGRGRGSSRTLELYNSRNALHAIDLIGNLYIPGPDTFCPQTSYRPDLCFEFNDGIDSPEEQAKMHYVLRVGAGLSGGLNPFSRYFLQDNGGPTRQSANMDEWNIADRSFFINPNSNQLIYSANRASAPVASSGTIRNMKSSDAYAWVLGNVGARPKDRDSVDINLISDVANRAGRIINCVSPDGTARCAKNAGGWPLYPMNERKLNLPANPLADDNGNGYTNLEEWLFSFSKQVE